MTKMIVVVTGPAGAGKTTLSRTLCNLEELVYKNVGDLLLQCLPSDSVSDRREIGTAYLRRFGLSGYCDTLLSHASLGVVFDGVRLAAGLTALRNHYQVLHIHKEGAGGVPTTDESVSNDLAWLRSKADLIVPWFSGPPSSEAFQRIVSRLAS